MTFSLPLSWPPYQGFLFFGPVFGPFLVFTFHWVLWFYKFWQGFIILLTLAIGGWLYMSIDVQQGIDLAS
jgi:hypothetical protein